MFQKNVYKNFKYKCICLGFFSGKKKQKTVKYQPLQLSLVRMPDDDRCTTVLKNDVCELQQRLTEVLNENQMMTKLQHHHKVALQHFEAVQSSITEVGRSVGCPNLSAQNKQKHHH